MDNNTVTFEYCNWDRAFVCIDLKSFYASVECVERGLDPMTTDLVVAEYAAKTVARPGYSEHHTGLALDLYFTIDGKDVYENEDLVQYPDIQGKRRSGKA